MTSLKMLPVGIENFKEIRRDGFYYVDKTNLIKELLESRGKANLFTRPRRFGKSLTKSMHEKHYTDAFKESDIHTVLKYGIVCNRKSCRVLVEKESF